MAAPRRACERDGAAARAGACSDARRAAARAGQANGVFVDLPRHAIEALHAKGWRFYTFVGETGVRLMCAWDTPAEAVDGLVADLRTMLALAPANGAVRSAQSAR